MSKILVTGGAGFIASHVVDAFIGAGHDVVAADNLSHGQAANVNPAAKFCLLDIRQTAELGQLLAKERFDCVDHHAAPISVRDSLEHPVEYAEINVMASIELLELARRAGVARFIFASSGGAAYGEGAGLPPFTEDRLPQPMDLYGASKVGFEYYLNAYRHNFGLDTVVLRYANVYGPRQDPFGEGGVVAIFSQRILARKPCTINGNGQKVRDFVFAGDVARANLAALEGPSGVYNIGTAEPTTIQAIFDGLRAADPEYGLEPVYAPDKPGEVWASCLNSERAAQVLGWQPRVSLSEGLRETINFFRQAAGQQM